MAGKPGQLGRRGRALPILLQLPNLAVEIAAALRYDRAKRVRRNGVSPEGTGGLPFEVVVGDDGQIMLLTVGSDETLDHSVRCLPACGIENLNSARSGLIRGRAALAIEDKDDANT